MSRRKQAKPQHLRSEEEATCSGWNRDGGRCPGAPAGRTVNDQTRENPAKMKLLLYFEEQIIII